VVLAALAVVIASSAHAYDPRVPQVAFATGSLQGYLNGLGESINVATDQLNAQVWQTGVSGNTEFTLMIELAGNAAANNIGIYNSIDPVPALFQVFPGAASAGWFANVTFRNGPSRAIVTLFDQDAVIQGQTTYLGVDRTSFGFYLQGPGGTFFSQDVRNGGAPQVLTYAGTGQNAGEWWQCFEDLPYNAGADFEDAVLLLQSVVPTPASTTTWGRLKGLYR
jgi:hypothetical protein